MLEIASISGNSISFTTPLHIAFDTAHTAQLTRYTVQATRYAGLEDLYVRGGRNDNIALRFAMYSWVKNVESDWSYGESIGMNACFRCVVRDSYFHDTPNPTPGGAGYMLSFAWYTSDSLVENNIFINGNKVMVMRASGGGNVIGYNYFDNGYIDYDTGWMETGINASHLTCPHFELFEGNQAFNADGDNTWGGAVDITFFRNHLTGKRRSFTDFSNRRAIGLMPGHYYYSFVGNVLGTVDQNPAPYTSFTYEDVTSPWADDPVPMWKLGYNPENWNAPAEARVLNTVHRHANFDYVTNSVHWAIGYDQTLPSSLYLTSKPAFFGSLPWPWIDPTGTTKTYTLPARARYDAGTPVPAVQVTSISPVSGPIAGGTTVTIRGSGFMAGATVTMGGVAASGIVVTGLTSLTAVTGANATGLADVTVTVPGPYSATYSATLSQAFFYVPPPVPAEYYTLTPCRLVDTRAAAAPALTPHERRVWTVTGRCGVPATATALAVNLTVAAPIASGYLRLTPGNGLTESSAINFSVDQTRANNAIVMLATDDSGSVAVTNGSVGTVHVILDVSGYFQ
jgi:hypothetical protein